METMPLMSVNIQPGLDAKQHAGFRPGGCPGPGLLPETAASFEQFLGSDFRSVLDTFGCAHTGSSTNVNNDAKSDPSFANDVLVALTRSERRKSFIDFAFTEIIPLQVRDPKGVRYRLHVLLALGYGKGSYYSWLPSEQPCPWHGGIPSESADLGQGPKPIPHSSTDNNNVCGRGPPSHGSDVGVAAPDSRFPAQSGEQEEGRLVLFISAVNQPAVTFLRFIDREAFAELRRQHGLHVTIDEFPSFFETLMARKTPSEFGATPTASNASNLPSQSYDAFASSNAAVTSNNFCSSGFSNGSNNGSNKVSNGVSNSVSNSVSNGPAMGVGGQELWYTGNLQLQCPSHNNEAILEIIEHSRHRSISFLRFGLGTWNCVSVTPLLVAEAQLSKAWVHGLFGRLKEVARSKAQADRARTEAEARLEAREAAYADEALAARSKLEDMEREGQALQQQLKGSQEKFENKVKLLEESLRSLSVKASEAQRERNEWREREANLQAANQALKEDLAAMEMERRAETKEMAETREKLGRERKLEADLEDTRRSLDQAVRGKDELEAKYQDANNCYKNYFLPLIDELEKLVHKRDIHSFSMSPNHPSREADWHARIQKILAEVSAKMAENSLLKSETGTQRIEMQTLKESLENERAEMRRLNKHFARRLSLPSLHNKENIR